MIFLVNFINIKSRLETLAFKHNITKNKNIINKYAYNAHIYFYINKERIKGNSPIIY